MTQLSKKRIQQIWDYELINHWDEFGRNKMWMVVKSFICRIYPEKEENYFDAEFDEVVDCLSSLGIKRCLDVNHVTGFYEFHSFNRDVIGFIHGRCDKLSMDLINSVPKPIILLSMNDYKWIKSNMHHNSKNTYKRRRIKLKKQTCVNVKARGLNTTTDWGVIS